MFSLVESETFGETDVISQYLFSSFNFCVFKFQYDFEKAIISNYLSFKRDFSLDFESLYIFCYLQIFIISVDKDIKTLVIFEIKQIGWKSTSSWKLYNNFVFFPA